MFNIFKTRKTNKLYNVTYKFIDDNDVFITTATAAGLTALATDWAIEVLEITKA